MFVNPVENSLTDSLHSTRPSPRPASYRSTVTMAKLECGHTPSKSAVQAHIQDSLCNKGQTAPSCCGRPLPRSVLETVLTMQEVDAIATLGTKSPDTVSMKDSAYGEDGSSSIDLPRSLPAQPKNFINETDTLQHGPSGDTGFLKQLLEDDSFKGLKAQQKEQFQRISVFESNQRKALLAYHHWSLVRLSSRLESSREEKTKQVGSRLCKSRHHISLLTPYSTPLTSNAWTSLRLLLSMTFERRMLKKRKTLQPH
jgi:hypothetical protein